ncbi:MAG TPA: hypothetical protein VLN48_01035 [Bryobacteraceae bacterium]|nr:hypothetical protein [Bryobacteraceae bacterium]
MFLISACFGQAPKFTISTAAGTGAAGFAGDGGQATAAQLRFPAGLAFDASGNIYIADSFNSRVRKVDTSGNISTIAGTGDFGYFGDGNTAAKAGLNRPYSVAVDKAGNIYIADAYNDAIRKVSTSGTMSSFAGSSQRGLGGDGGAATGALLDTPTGLVLDAAGNLYIADTGNNRIRKVGTDGIISTFAGSGATGYSGDGGPATSAGLNAPQGIAVDNAGNVYVSDTLNHRVRKITPDGTISTVAGNGNGTLKGDGGPATQASLYYPKGLAVDRSGNLYIADWLNSRIRMVTTDGIIWTVAGNGSFDYQGDGGPATSAALRFPWGLAVDGASNVYVADDENSVIRLLKPVATLTSQVPKIDLAGVTSAAAFGGFASVAPGSWIEIHGSHLANHARAWTAADFQGTQAPTSLDGVSVTIGGQPAFISYVSPDQINAEIPSGAHLGPQEVRVLTAAGASDPQMITVNEIQPGLLAPAALMIGDKQYTQAVSADGATVAVPSGAMPAAARPARPGETIVLYGVGFGPVTSGIGAGDVVQQDNSLLLPFQVFFGGTPAAVNYAGLAPGSVGLYQFNVVVPETAGAAVPLSFALGGRFGQQMLYTAVQP